MRVLGAGLSRTGTKSLNKAMRILGYRSIHFDTQFTVLLQLAGKDGRLELGQYDDVDAVFDTPPALFYREFMARYPGLKIILSTRNEDDWWRSIKRNLNQLPVNGPLDYSRGWRWPATTWYQRILSFGWQQPNEFIYRKRYREHNEAVRAYVRPGDLLEIDVTAGQGWRELCSFLGKDIPERPFPRTG